MSEVVIGVSKGASSALSLIDDSHETLLQRRGESLLMPPNVQTPAPDSFAMRLCLVYGFIKTSPIEQPAFHGVGTRRPVEVKVKDNWQVLLAGVRGWMQDPILPCVMPHKPKHLVQ